MDKIFVVKQKYGDNKTIDIFDNQKSANELHDFLNFKHEYNGNFYYVEEIKINSTIYKNYYNLNQYNVILDKNEKVIINNKLYFGLHAYEDISSIPPNSLDLKDWVEFNEKCFSKLSLTSALSDLPTLEVIIWAKDKDHALDITKEMLKSCTECFKPIKDSLHE
jgi:hypothetical protein